MHCFVVRALKYEHSADTECSLKHKCQSELIERKESNVEVQPLYNLFLINGSEYSVATECIVSCLVAYHVSIRSTQNALILFLRVKICVFDRHRILFEANAFIK